MRTGTRGRRWMTYVEAAAFDPDHDFPCHTVSRSLSEARRDAEDAGYVCAIFVGDVINGRMDNERFVECWPSPQEPT